MTVEFDDVQGLQGRRRRTVARHALQVSGAGQAGAAAEAAQDLCTQGRGEGADAHAVGVEGVVGRGQAEDAALAQEVHVHVLQAAQAKAQPVVGGALLDGDGLGAYLLSDPLREGGMMLQEFRERPSRAGSIVLERHLRDALIVGHARVGHQRAPTEDASVLVDHLALGE